MCFGTLAACVQTNRVEKSQDQREEEKSWPQLIHLSRDILSTWLWPAKDAMFPPRIHRSCMFFILIPASHIIFCHLIWHRGFSTHVSGCRVFLTSIKSWADQGASKLRCLRPSHIISTDPGMHDARHIRTGGVSIAWIVFQAWFGS